MASPHGPLNVEALDARILPSGLAPLPPHTAATALAAPAATGPVHPPSGGGEGVYLYDAVQSGAGVEYRMAGAADLAGLGPVTFTGWLRGVGFIANGRAAGTLTFVGADGSVKVRLDGPEQPGFSPMPHTFRYQIVSGSGAFAHRVDRGTLTLAFGPAAGGPLQNPHGSFTLGLDVAPPRPPFQGGGGGTASPLPVPADTGAEYALHGSANLVGMGRVAVDGTVTGVGFIDHGQAAGTLTFRGAHGSVTVRLLGPTQPGLAALPRAFRYQVIGGTGSYAHLSGHGVLELILHPARGDSGHETFTLLA